MGKAGRWLRSFFLTGRRDKKAKDRDRADSQSLLSTVPTPASTPSAKEKRRWSFRRAAASGKDTGESASSHCFSELHVVVVQEQQHAVAAIVPPASTGRRSGDDEEATAATRIQLAFRSYLARKALCALRGMVKLQAMVRGQLVRRQASVTLRRMQALLAAQKRARAERLRLLGDDKPLIRTPRPRPPASRRSPHHHRNRRPLDEENVKIVEVDDGGCDAYGATRTSCGRRGGGYFSTPLSRTPAKAELYQPKASPAPSGATDGSARTLSSRFNDYSASFSAASEASGRHRGGKSCHAAADHAAALLFPNYMSNTESSRAKARSQSAPRQRPWSDEAAASPSPSCERHPGWGGARRRASLDPRDLAVAGARSGAPSPRSSGARMERCASQARASASAACPWAVRLDRSSVSLAGSECGSSTTAVTSARIA